MELFFFDTAAANNSEEKVPKIDYAQTVLDLQEKLSRVSCANLATSSPSPSTTTGYLLIFLFQRAFGLIFPYLLQFC